MNSCNQLLEKAESLKKELSNSRNGLSSDGSGKGEWVSSRTSLQDVYRQLLITNLEYALDKKIEQDLWNFAFKNHITALQQQVKDKSNTYRAEAQSQLTSFLDAASGFYLHLLDDLCQTFHVNIPYRVSSSKLIFLKESASVKRSSVTQPERPSCQYMCQHCLVHLGDIARYRNQITQAESYYRYAAHLVPSNGQPYNQLAILASASGDVLSTAFYYCRSLAVKCPFPGSDTNLRKQLNKIMAGDDPRHTKISTSELVKFCLKFHGCIYLKKNEQELKGLVEKLSGYIRAHLRAGSLSRQQITYMTFLNLFSLHHLSPNGLTDAGDPLDASTDSGRGKSDDSENSPAKKSPPFENITWGSMLNFTMHMLGGLLACVPVHSDDISDLEHPVLPSIKLTLDWLSSNVAALHRVEVAQNSRVWPRLAKVLNALGNQDKANNMDNRYLPEDLDVRGFIGLKVALSKLDFITEAESGIPADMKHACRCYRLYRLGVSISNTNSDLLSFVEDNSGTLFSSSISPSPQHGANMNGVEEMSEEEMEEEDEDQENNNLSASSSPSAAKQQETAVPETQLSSTKREPRTKGVLKVATDEHPSALRKKNRAPRMQNVAVQIKPENKLKAIKEEDGSCGDNALAGVESESAASTESSQSDISPAAGTHTRSGHRVTFAAQQMSPTQYLKEDTPPPAVAPGYMEQGNVLIQGNPMYQDAGSQLVQPAYLPNIHVVSQQMGPIYRHPPVGSPILTGPYARRGMGPYPYTHNVITRPHVPIPPFQHMHPSNTPPHPADLPKPVFQGSLYNPVGASESYRPRATNTQLTGPSGVDANVDQIGKMSRPNDIGYFQLLQNQAQNVGGMSPISQDASPTQRPIGPTMAAHFNRPPAMNISTMQQIRLQEMARNASGMMPESGNKPRMDPSSNPGIGFQASNMMKSMQQGSGPDFSAFGGNQHQAQMIMRQQAEEISRQSTFPPSGHLQTMESEFARTPSELARSYFQRNFMGPPSTNATGGSNNTSSTSSPTPGTLNNQLASLSNSSSQAGNASNISYGGVSNMLSHGFSSMLKDQAGINSELNMQRRPNTLPNQSLMQHGNIVGFSDSPGQKLTPTGLGTFAHLEQQPESDYSREGNTLSTASMFGISPSSSSHLNDDLMQLGQQSVNQSPTADNFSTYTMPQDRVKAIFEDPNTDKSFTQVRKSPMDSLQVSQSSVDKFHDSLLSKEDKDSYKLFPDTDSSWGIPSHSSRGLVPIGSERAAAQNSQRYNSPWGGPPLNQPPTSVMTSLPNKLERSLQKQAEMNPRRSEGFPGSQSFWTSPMVPSGPSALEQLIRQQQQQHHLTRDKSPP
ncbi:uncharacterized protein LOC143468832 [Clavelina lepadiformis]|uniref:uncharacterized protein LOC143468832 n=1 Tax=Clavelina lepadiformis TaxID=159417 RepID=UPI0040424257